MLNEAINPGRLRGGGSAYAQTLIDRLQSGGRHIVQVVVGFLFRLSRPEIDVWFVPNLEVPIRHLLDAVPLYQVAREKENELVPLPGIPRRSHVRMIPKRMRAWSFCHLLWHKAEFDKGFNSNLQQTVINQVNAREIQPEVARGVLAAKNSCLMLKNPMKSDILHVHDLSQRSKIFAPIFTEGHRGVAGTENMFPE